MSTFFPGCPTGQDSLNAKFVVFIFTVVNSERTSSGLDIAKNAISWYAGTSSSPHRASWEALAYRSSQAEN
ncbi:hypothetical protein LTR22_019664 [Elasticomyces elasticus]|nr:hypothetical protein LTR22_019664 [Elasticomyces elasticus]KAK4930471.1 hypothetical protein LTR49_002879 [Elasticomyces elasticus]KAK5745067.1 hypothetical protein LTS12_023259 [Elasticomyces elasticus]